jgi:molybdenum cofactor biosynthesis enzyme MoaA
MIKYNEITDVHLEITSNCQASCPMCMRNFHGGMSNPNLKLRDMSIDEFKKIFSISFVNQLKQIYLCGNYGDPIINNHLIKMVKYIKDSNKTITGNKYLKMMI